VVAAVSFTPVPRFGYRIGVPAAGAYRELLNSDAEVYGGSNLGNQGVVHSEPVAAHGFAQSLRLTVPPLGFLLFKADRPAASEAPPEPAPAA
jgi:1,4-alpha-glucan branching enzyme